MTTTLACRRCNNSTWITGHNNNGSWRRSRRVKSIVARNLLSNSNRTAVGLIRVWLHFFVSNSLIVTYELINWNSNMQMVSWAATTTSRVIKVTCKRSSIHILFHDRFAFTGDWPGKDMRGKGIAALSRVKDIRDAFASHVAAICRSQMQTVAPPSRRSAFASHLKPFCTCCGYWLAS